MSDDALAIANLKALYCRAADMTTTNIEAARAIFAGLFVEDFVGDYGFRVLRGEREIVEFMGHAIGGGSEWMIHALGSPLIRVDGDAATGDWTVRVESRRRDGRGLMSVVGRYADTFRKTDEGWRIATIKFERYE